MSFALAQKVADAVLYEGYVLYPYRASSAKNRVRFQFGVVAPRGGIEPGSSESWEMQTECLVAPAGVPEVTVKVRFLQLQARTVEAARGGEPPVFVPVDALDVLNGGERRLVAWEEGVEREVELRDVRLADLLGAERRAEIELPGGEAVEELRAADGTLLGRLVRRRWPLAALVRLGATPAAPSSSAGAADRLLRLRVRIENTSPWPPGAPPDRAAALRTSLLGAHTLLAVRGGAFVSLLEPPPPAAVAAAACVNLHTWPVLAGEAGGSEVMLSSPIILYDHPAVAPESPGDLFDATEIDEILTLRTMTLTDDEKREARGTDERAARIVDRCGDLPPDALARLHGAVRSLTPAAAPETSLESWEELLQPAGMTPPEEATVEVAGALVARGSRVRLRPSRRADSMDLFLAGRAAEVAAVHRDVEGTAYVAVTLADDPAADLHARVGRYFYFYPDEIEPLED